MSQKQNTRSSHPRLVGLGLHQIESHELYWTDSGRAYLDKWSTPDGRDLVVIERCDSKGKVQGSEFFVPVTSVDCPSATLDAVLRWIQEGR